MPKATNAAAVAPVPAGQLAKPTAEDDLAAINAALAASGLITIGDSDFQRVKIKGSTFEFPDGDVVVSNQKTKAPAFYGRLLDIPIEYQAAFLDDEDAAMLNRPDAAGRFCKSRYDIVNQAGKFAEDGTSCGTCPINPFTKKENSPLRNNKKCGWRADIVFQLCDSMGNSDDATEYTLSLSTTSVMELKGTSKDKVKGYATDMNFMQKLARYAVANVPAANVTEAVTKIGTMLRIGNVIASFRLEGVSRGSNNFEVVVLDPVNLVIADAPATGLPPGEAAAAVGTDADFDLDSDLPF